MVNSVSVKIHLYNQAHKAMHSVLKTSKKLGLAIDLQLQLFDKLATPILLYGAEIWSCGNNDIIEKFTTVNWVDIYYKRSLAR